jgi:IS30 family transposase
MRHMATSKYKHFTKNDRNELSILLKKGYSLRDMSKVLLKNPSSISREFNNNSVNGEYVPEKAQHKAYVKRKYSKYQGMKIRDNTWIERNIQAGFRKGWTPEEIAGRLRYENNNQTVISFKAIYEYLETPFGEPFKRYLASRTWRKRKSKRSKQIIENRVFIDKRPEIINSRTRYGDLEGDTLGVPKTSQATLAGLVDRKSLYFLVKKISRLKETILTFKEMLNQFNPQSLTLDNGLENARYDILKVPTYFCHPYSAWEKPLIENSFQRLRRYIPKKAKLSDYSEQEISAIIEKMNNTPRKSLGFRTPKEVFFQQQIPSIKLPTFNFQCCT